MVNSTAEIDFEKQIWAAADILRGNMDAADEKLRRNELDKRRLGGVVVICSPTFRWSSTALTRTL